MRRLIACAVACLAGAILPAWADYTVTGRFVYVDRPFGPDGFLGTEVPTPIRQADVQVLAGTKIVGAGVTDANGFFVLTVVASRAQDIYVRCLARRQQGSGIPLEVRAGNQSGDVWSIRSQTFTGHDPNQDLYIGTLAAVPDSGGEAFNLYDSILNGALYLDALRGGPASAPTLLVVFNAANPNLSSYSGNTIVQARNAGYDDTVVLHEMGHYVVDNFSATDSPFGTHRLSDCNQNMSLAFDEGHASFWGNSVRRYHGLPWSAWYVRTTGLAGPGNLQFSFNTETQQPFVCRGATSEMTVLAALWDIVDGPTTPDDGPGGGPDGVDEAWDLLRDLDADYWRVMTAYLPTPAAAYISLEDFWDGWFSPAIPNPDRRHPEMVSIFRELGVEYFEDEYEPNDQTATAARIGAGPLLRHATFFADVDNDLLGEADTDLFVFDAVAGASYTIETLNLLGGADTILDLLAANGSTVIATNDDRSDTDLTSLIPYTATQSGALHVRVTHALGLGIYGSYDLRVSSPDAGIDGDLDGYTTATDCNDADPAIHPGATELCNGRDDDCDGTLDEGYDRDSDGYTSCAGDCNDVNPAVRPGAVEECNSVDDDCDTLVDEGFDGDGDGHTPCGGDCNDADPAIHPGAPEACNGQDDNCEGRVDESFDLDGDDWTTCSGDCNDSDPLIHPGAAEDCNGVDDDCDLAIDEGLPDTDGDGQVDCLDPDDDNDGVADPADCAPTLYSASARPVEVVGERLTHSAGRTRVAWDAVPQTNVYNIYRGVVPVTQPFAFATFCLLPETTAPAFEDAQTPMPETIYYYMPAATNLCGEGTVGTGTAGAVRPLPQPCLPQGRDTDLDQVMDLIDNCPATANGNQADGDRDGRGDACDNCIAVVNPEQRDRDANAIGDLCQDLDGDGVVAEYDCDDTRASVHPGAPEICDGLDNDCDMLRDEGFDLDGDGYTTCGGDCNDAVAAIRPGATEIFNGVDDNCDTVIDNVTEVVTISLATWQAGSDRLTVEATTNYPAGSVSLTVVGFGSMTYVQSAGVYRLVVSGVANPGTVTVNSTAGGSATGPVTSI
jgi:hypothetical protein